MTREEAGRTVEAFFRGQGRPGAGLSEKGVAGAMLGTSEIFFAHDAGREELKCSALVYRFREEPKPGVIEAFRREERRGAADTGGGVIDYQPESRGLFLSRAYTGAVREEQFADDMKRLAGASLVWGNEVLDRIASGIFHPEETGGEER